MVKIKEKKGYVAVEAIIIVAITLVVAIAVFISYKNSERDATDNVGNQIATADTYMGSQIKNAYNSDYGGATLDDGWTSGGGSGNQGTVVPVYKLVEKLQTTKNEYSIRVGEEIKDLAVSVYPTNASQSKLSWKVLSGKDKTLITRDTNGHLGTVLGLKAGKTAIRISATDGSGISHMIFVNVGQPVTGLKLDKEGQTLTLSYSGIKQTTVKATVLPDTGDSIATERRVSWSFGNGGMNSECFEMTPDYKEGTVTIGLTSTSLKKYCVSKSITIIAKTEDGGFQKQFTVSAAN